MNPPPNPPTPLQSEIERYTEALSCLSHPKTKIKQTEALEILATRDALQKQIETETPIPADILTHVQGLDSSLKKQAYRVTEAMKLTEYRMSFSVPPQSWWWNLETTGDPHPWNRFDLVFKGMRLTAWTVNLGLLGILATRFLSGGSGVIEAIAVAFPTILTLLQGKNELSEAGQKTSDQLLSKLRIPAHLKEEAKLGWTLLSTAILGSIWLSQPKISDLYNQEGKKQQENNQFSTAEQNYIKAIAFNDANSSAHYKLGNLYEEWLDVDNAQKQYAIAAKSGSVDAYNNLGRLYIRQKKYAEAATLLFPIVMTLDDRKEIFSEVKYSILKNLGWARFEQRADDAIVYLQMAIEEGDRPEVAKYSRNPGAAHCLLAQVLERQKQPESMTHWRLCQKLVGQRRAAGEQINPEEDDWLIMASKKLNKGGK